MRIGSALLVVLLAAMQLVGCTPEPNHDLGRDQSPEIQAEIREVLKDIMRDVETANVAGLSASHLGSSKFTKFSGRDFERQDVEQCNEAESRFVSTLQDLKLEMRDTKIDVFGDGLLRYYYRAAA